MLNTPQSNIRTSAASAKKSTSTVTGNSNSTDFAALTTIDGESAWICAIAEGRGTGKEVGVAMLESGTGRCTLSQFADTQLYGHLLHLLYTHPTKIVLLPGPTQLTASHINHGGEHDTLRRTLQQNLDLSIVNLHRKLFDEQEGSNYLRHLLRGGHQANDQPSNECSTTELVDVADQSRSVLSAVSTKYFALSAACALFKYFEGDHHGRLPSGSISLSYQAPEGTIMIDVQTIKSLELIQNSITKKSIGTLYGLLNYCSTPMGERLIRMNIVQPMADPDHLRHRFDAVEELIAESERFFALRDSLKAAMKKRVDVDKIISQMMRPPPSRRGSDPKAIEAALSQLINIRHIFSSMSSICAALSGCQSLLLRAVQSLLQDEKVAQIVETIDACIHSDLLQGTAKSSLSSRNARLYAVRAGRDSILDAARQTYQENTADALEQCERYAAQYNLPFKIVHSTSSTSGYSLELSAGEVRPRDLPKQFVNVAKTRGGKSLTMTTVDLKKCNQRMNDSMQEVFLLSENVVESLRLEATKDVGTMYKASEALALIDAIISLTHSAMAGRYTRPQFGDSLIIEGGRHPILDHKNHQTTIPNDTRLDRSHSFQLLSGPNSSGKTTYLKQVALLTVMAHIGSFVPAQSAIFPPCDKILSRLSNSDEPDANLSTFATEMKTMALILDRATDSSLVLIDELGRATSTHEGIGIAHAISEQLIQRKITTICATHFVQLASTLSRYPNFSCHHLMVSLSRQADGPHSFTFRHQIAEGVSGEEHYGIVLARDCHLPLELIEEADRMARDLIRRANAAEKRSNGTQAVTRRSIVMQLLQQLQDLHHSTDTTATDLREQLINLQEGFVARIDDNLPTEPGTETETGPEAETEADSDEEMAMTVNEMLSDYQARC